MKNKILQLGEAITLMLWGAWVGTSLFDAFSTAKVYDLLKAVASEEAWGIFTFLAGAIQLAFLYTKYIRISCILSLVGMLVFIMLTVFYLHGNWASTAVPAYLAFSIYSALAFAEAKEIQKLGSREK